MQKMIIRSSLSVMFVAGLLVNSVAMADEQKETAEPVLTKEAVAKQHDKHQVKWGYEGDGAPANWGKLSADFALCEAGLNQSPVDIKNTFDANLLPIKFKYNMLAAESIENNGHTIQINMWSGGEITLDGKVFKLKQFHFHTPSENTIQGRQFPLEMQLVHISEDGELAVVAALFQPGNDDPLVETLWNSMPMEASEPQKLDARAVRDLEFENELQNYYRFNGSLTTPPCTEGVNWIVMKNFRSVSERQVLKLQKALKYPNNRPIQKLNARVVIE